MKLIHLLLLAGPLLGAVQLAAARPLSDPRVAINALNTPGTAQAVFRISNPGSYYLEADLLGEAGKAGIMVMSSDVRIDLMGFHLRGAAGSTHAIAENAAQSNIVIWNGTLSDWSGVGVQFVQSSNVQIRDLSFRFMGDGGIALGTDGVVERCNLLGVAGFGIRTNYGAYVSQTMVNGVGTRGIQVLSNSLVRDCKVRGSGTEGIYVDVGSSVFGCVVSGGSVGIYAFAGLVADCTVNATYTVGVRLDAGTLRSSHILGNAGHGVELASAGSLAVGNRVIANGGDGIRALGGARIEENDVRSHPHGAGIRTFGSGSFVVKNTLFANSLPLSVPNAGNFVGPLVSANAVNGREEPWANVHGN